MIPLLSSTLISWYEDINEIRTSDAVGLTAVEIPVVQNRATLPSHISKLKDAILDLESNTYYSYAEFDKAKNLIVASGESIKSKVKDDIEYQVSWIKNICANDTTSTCQTQSYTTNTTNDCTTNNCTTSYNDCMTTTCSTNKTNADSTTTNQTNSTNTFGISTGNATYGASRITGNLTTYAFTGDYTADAHATCVTSNPYTSTNKTCVTSGCYTCGTSCQTFSTVSDSTNTTCSTNDTLICQTNSTCKTNQCTTYTVQTTSIS